MSESNKGHIVGVAAQVTAAASMKADAYVVMLEERLVPVFRDMDEARLFRLTHGDERIPEAPDNAQNAARLIARYVFEERKWEKSERSAQEQARRQREDEARRNRRLAIYTTVALVIGTIIRSYYWPYPYIFS